MILKHDGYLELIQQVNICKKRLICFGAGMIPYYAEDLLIECNIVDAIEVFVDNNEKKWGTTMFLFGKEIPVTSPLHLYNIDVEKYILLITCERYFSVVDQLVQMKELSNLWCYVFPEVNYDYYIKNVSSKKLALNKEILIPPIIHYCWFGQKEKDELTKKCIASWKEYCPNYQIIEWNEANYNIGAHKYTLEAYKEKKWAYVSDVARLEMLYKYGGIYFDTDVELIRPIEDMRTNKGFILYGEWSTVNSGAGVGCIAKNNIIGDMIKTRKDKSFYDIDGSFDCRTNSYYEAWVLRRHGFKMNMQFQRKNDFVLFPVDIIAPSSVLGEDIYVSNRTLGRHYCLNSWREKDEKRTRVVNKSCNE